MTALGPCAAWCAMQTAAIYAWRAFDTRAEMSVELRLQFPNITDDEIAVLLDFARAVCR